MPVGVLDEPHRQRRERPRIRIGLVLVGVRVDLVGPRRTVRGDRGQRIGEGVHIVRRRAEPQAHARRSGQALVVPGAALVEEPMRLGVVDAQQPHHQRVRAEAPVPDADAVLGRQDRRELVVRHVAEVEGEEAHAGVRCGPDAVMLEAGDRRQSLACVRRAACLPRRRLPPCRPRRACRRRRRGRPPR